MRNLSAAWLVWLTLLTSFAGPAQAETELMSSALPVFVGLIPTEPGTEGERGIATDLSMRLGRAKPGFAAIATKTELSQTLTADLWSAVSLFGTRISQQPPQPLSGSSDRTGFDGLSGELAYRVLPRTSTQPFSVMLSVEPRWARMNAYTGARAQTFWVEGKAFVDAFVIPDRLLWSASMTFAPAVQEDHGASARWFRYSGLNAATALTYAFSPQLFAGAELRYAAAFSGLWANVKVGEAFFLGPTLTAKLSEQTTLSLAWSLQVSGYSAASGSRSLDLNLFERQNLRARLAVSF